MLLLFLLQSSLALDLVEYKFFQIEFQPNCTHYLTFLGSTDYVHLNQSDGHILLLIGRNESYHTYQAPYLDHVVFSWPDKTVNGMHMELIERVGEFEEPLSLDVGSIHCKVFGLRLGTLFTDTEVSSLTYECPTASSWKIYFPVALTILLSLILAGGGYKTLEPRILGKRMEQLNEVSTIYRDVSRNTPV